MGSLLEGGGDFDDLGEIGRGHGPDGETGWRRGHLDWGLPDRGGLAGLPKISASDRRR